MTYTPSDQMVERIANDFTYHAPHGDQAQRYEEIRARFKELAVFLLSITPPSREQSLALTLLEESVFYANAAIARNEAKA